LGAEVNAFFFQELNFLLDGAVADLALVAAEFEIGADDAVAGNLGGEGVAFEGLADGLGGAATEMLGEELVGGDFTGRYFFEGAVNFLFEEGGGTLGFHGGEFSEEFGEERSHK
jgi:hypothetical protein